MVKNIFLPQYLFIFLSQYCEQKCLVWIEHKSDANLNQICLRLIATSHLSMCLLHKIKAYSPWLAQTNISTSHLYECWFHSWYCYSCLKKVVKSDPRINLLFLLPRLIGHSNNMWHSRREGLEKLWHVLFVVLNWDFKLLEVK